MKFERWEISRHVLEETAAAFARGRHEVFVIWTTPLYTTGTACRVSRCVVPAQRPGFAAGGAYVHIEGAELDRIQFMNFDRRDRSVVQLHTHPSVDVRMSELDRRWEVVCHIGALSIIVPSYGDRGLIGFPGANVYEREDVGWRLWSRAEIDNRLRIVP